QQFYLRYRECCERWQRAWPDDRDALRERSIADEKLGDVSLALGDLGAAQAAYDQGLQHLVPLQADVPQDPLLKRYLASMYSRLGNVRLRQSRFAEALDYYKQALTLREQLQTADPDNPRIVRELALAYESLAWTSLRRGDLAEARKDFNRALVQR